MLSSRELSDERQSRLCTALLAVGSSLRGLDWVQRPDAETSGMDSDQPQSLAVALAAWPQSCSEARRLNARYELRIGLWALERLASATTIHAGELADELGAVAGELRRMSGEDVEVAVRMMDELGTLAIFEALAESARDEGQPVDAIAGVLLALCLRPAGLALVIRTLGKDDALARWQQLLVGEGSVAVSRIDDSELYAALTGTIGASSAVVASALTALLAVAAVVASCAGDEARVSDMLSLWTAGPVTRVVRDLLPRTR